MKRTKRPSLLLALALASLALLPLLAFWQYRWLGEVSVAERERMQRNLQASAAQFSQEFDRELTHAYLFFQPNTNIHVVLSGQSLPTPTSAEAHAKSPNDLPTRYQEWQATSPHARLVKAIYEARLTAQGQYELVRFDLPTARFESAEWTDELAHVRANLSTVQKHDTALQKVVQSLTIKSRNSLPNHPANSSYVRTTISFDSPRPLDESLPGLLIPLRQFEPQELPPPPCDYRIVLFDLAYIQQQWLPELAQRFLFSHAARDYTCAVMKQEQTPELKTVYQSDTALTPASFATSDVSMPLFKLRFEDVDRLLLPGLAGFTAKLGESAHLRPRMLMSVVGNDQTNVKIERPLGSDKAMPSLGETVQAALQARREGAWRLVIKHRAGSLEAAVNQVRRRNLAISFGVILLLGVSVGLVLMASRRAQALAEQQIEFVAGVSHELRTPLAVICSAAENLADGVVNNRDQIKQYGTLIRDEGRRLGGMVEQVLEFAGVQSGKRTYELRPVNARAVIEEALAALQLPLSEQGFTVEQELPVELPVIRADVPALSRALQNLLTNAMKYSGDSRWIGLRGVVQGQELRLTVQDRGLGIPADELSHLGEPFYRGKEAVAAQIHGNGLGLSLVKHIAQVHGGRLSVESKAGQGSQFTLHLPWLAQPASAQSALSVAEAK